MTDEIKGKAKEVASDAKDKVEDAKNWIGSKGHSNGLSFFIGIHFWVSFTIKSITCKHKIFIRKWLLLKL